MNLDYKDIVHFGEQLLTLERMYKQFAEEDLREYLWWRKSVKLNDNVLCSFWNRGYSIEVEEVKLRESDDSVMVCGKNLYDNKQTEEFFSYILSYRDMKRIVEQILIY